MISNANIRFSGEIGRALYIQGLEEQIWEARLAPIVTASSYKICAGCSCCDCAYAENQSENIDKDTSAADDLDEAVAAFYADEDASAADDLDEAVAAFYVEEDASAATDLDEAVAAFYADNDFEGFDGFENLDPDKAYNEASDFDEFDMIHSEDEDDEVAVTLSDLFCKWKEVQRNLSRNLAALSVAVCDVEELLDDLFNALI